MFPLFRRLLFKYPLYWLFENTTIPSNNDGRGNHDTSIIARGLSVSVRKSYLSTVGIPTSD